MSLLKMTLAVKIFFTLACWALPLLVICRSMFEAYGVQTGNSFIFVRLLGWSFLALVVCYLWGYWRAKASGFPWVTVLVGIVSNGGATLMTAFFLLHGDLDEWEFLPKALIATAPVVCGFITIGLAVCLVRETRRTPEAP